MDDTTLESLRAAFALTPSNHALLAVVVRAHLGLGEAVGRAVELLAGTDAAALPDDARLAAAEAFQAADRPERALELALDWRPGSW